MSVLVMNVHGPGHDAFDEARKRYEGTPGIAFFDVGEIVDVKGNPIAVGEGDALDVKSRAMKKTLPLTKVGFFACTSRVGVCACEGGGRESELRGVGGWLCIG